MHILNRVGLSDYSALFLSLVCYYSETLQMGAIDKAKIELIQGDAAKGVPLAQYNLGLMYLTGKGMPKDCAKAVEWYTKAAEQGDVVAQYALYSIFWRGYGVQRDLGKAIEWLTMAANAGHVRAQSDLGALYLGGRGVPKNTTLAYAWLSLASIYGYRHWLHSINSFLAKHGLTKDESIETHRTVMRWLKKRREQAKS